MIFPPTQHTGNSLMLFTTTQTTLDRWNSLLPPYHTPGQYVVHIFLRYGCLLAIITAITPDFFLAISPTKLGMIMAGIMTPQPGYWLTSCRANYTTYTRTSIRDIYTPLTLLVLNYHTWDQHFHLPCHQRNPSQFHHLITVNITVTGHKNCHHHFHLHHH